MKRSHNYEINHNTNTVVVTKRFMEAASQIDTKEYDLFQRFQDMGYRVVVEVRKTKKPSASPLRKLNHDAENRIPLIKFEKMARYIALLDDAEEMMDEFDEVRRVAQSQKSPRRYVNEWFRRTFPRYEDMPEFDDGGCVVHNPNPSVEIQKVS